MPTLDELVDFLDQLLHADHHPDDVGGVYVTSTRPIGRVGLALEPWPEIGAWAQAERLDAVFLHRPWQLDAGTLPPGIGVIAYHRAFDERLALAFNLELAAALGMSELEVFGTKDGRPIGMLGEVAQQDVAIYSRRLETVFGGLDRIAAGNRRDVTRVVVAGAMTDALVREAARRKADMYVTGQWRQPAEATVAATGIAVVVTGHRRSEAWGLRQLAQLMEEHWSGLQVILASD